MKNLLKLLMMCLLLTGKAFGDTEPGNNAPGTTTDAISIGGSQNGSLGSGDNYDYYQLTTVTDGNIVINASDDVNNYLYIYLYDSDGTTQLAGTAGYALSGISITASGLQAGNYYVLVYCASGTNYTVTANLVTPTYTNDTEPNNAYTQASPLSMSNPVTGHIAYRANGGTIDNYDYYQVTSNADGDIVVNLNNDNNAYNYIYLYDNDGTTQLNATAGYALSGITMTTNGLAAGIYYVVVYGTGYCSYTMTTSLNANPIPNDLVSNTHFINASSFAQNDSINGHIAYRNNGGSYDNYDFYSFYSSGDYDITLFLNNNNDAYTYIYLYDTDTTTQLGAIAGYAQSGISLTTTGLAAGTYYIMVYAGSGSYSGYTLKNTYSPNPLAGDPEPNNVPAQATPFNVNSSLTGHIAYRNTGGTYDSYDYYQLVTTDDGNLQLSLNNTNNAYTYIYLLDNDGTTQLGAIAGYAQSGITLTANGLAAGTYYVLVFASGGSYSGYSLSNTLTATPYANDTEDNGTYGTALLLNNSPVKTGHIGHRNNGGSYDLYDYRKITMLNTDSFRIELSFSNSNYAYVYLYNAAQNQIYANAGFGGSFVIFFNSLPAGDYYLVVYASAYNSYIINNFYYPCDASPSVITAGGPTTFCQGGNVSLNSSNAYNGYLWSNNETTGSITTGSPGNYVLTALDFDGCPHTSNTISVTVLPYTIYYADGDGDGYGNPALTQTSCTGAPAGYVSDNTDCNDGNSAINPGATEVCNNTDDDCDGLTDEGLAFVTYYADVDGDTYGNAAATVSSCIGAPAGYVSDNTDCNDGNSAVNPGTTEVCNNIDDDCDGQTDEGLTFLTYYIDADNDSYGSTSSTQSTCNGAPTGYVSNSTDCNDASNAINPGATELCNGIDDNCNGNTDEGCSTYTYFADSDGDGYGNPAVSTGSQNPVPPAGYVANNGDCNDGNSAINPGAQEVCNNIDDNCNGTTDEGLTFLVYYSDGDGDGYGNASVSQSTCDGAPAGYVSNNGDCNDGNSAINPGTQEVCNNIDDNCNGTTDEGLTFLVYYADGDGDGYGNTSVSQSTCNGAPSGYVSNNSDCNDGNSAINPGALEICNNLDDNCDGVTDEGCGGCGAPGPINGPSQLCAPTGQLITYSIPAVPGANSYQWTVPAGTLIVSGQGTNVLVVRWPFSVIHSGLSGDICVTYTATCGTSAPACLSISVQLATPVRPATISGPNKACAGDVFTYSTALVSRATQYNWSVPSGASIQNGNGTNVILVQFDPSFAGGQITVSASNGCGSSPLRARDISRNILRAPSSINGLAKGVCGASGVGYTCAVVVGASSYQWTVPAGATITSGQGTTSVTVNYNGSFTGGVVSVYAINSCGGGASRTLNVTGAPASPGTISGTTTTCTDQIYTYEVQAVPGASNYNWILPSHLQIISGQGTKTLVVKTGLNAIADFTISVKCSNACGISSASKLEHISSSLCPRMGSSELLRSIMVYPNPVQSTLNIRFKSSKNSMVTVQLIDASGRMVYSKKANCFENENILQLDLEGIASGIYTLSLRDEGPVTYTKIVIE